MEGTDQRKLAAKEHREHKGGQGRMSLTAKHTKYPKERDSRAPSEKVWNWGGEGSKWRADSALHGGRVWAWFRLNF